MSAPADPGSSSLPEAGGGWTGGWTGAVRRRAVRGLPPEKLLPDTQPAYMASWIYLFGVLTIAALIAVLVSGGWLALEGPAWWHTSGVGHYVNSLHLWSVELFMFFMVVHLWGKFLMAAWRGRRALTWVTGAVAFLASVGTAFTGYLVQQNFDSQWIAGQAKDGLNAVGIGAYFNVADFGQMLMWHIVLLPFALGLLTVWHILLVRRRGIVPPIGATAPEAPDVSRAAPAAPAETAAGPAAPTATSPDVTSPDAAASGGGEDGEARP